MEYQDDNNCKISKLFIKYTIFESIKSADIYTYHTFYIQTRDSKTNSYFNYPFPTIFVGTQQYYLHNISLRKKENLMVEVYKMINNVSIYLYIIIKFIQKYHLETIFKIFIML